MQALILRFDAPLMSFGGDAVDSNRVTDSFPRRSMIAGLLANALGYNHADWQKTQRLQARLRYAVRRDRTGRTVVDFQTVDLGQEFLRETWTSRGVPEGRGGSVSTGTHIQHRHYSMDAIYTLAVGFQDEKEERPTFQEIERAMFEPARPLCLGRKACVPSEPVYQSRQSGVSLYEILKEEPRLSPRYRPDTGHLEARWPLDGPQKNAREVFLTEDRDWRNGIHVGRRLMYQGRIDPVAYLQMEGE